jgi:hypothetical protein
MEDADGEIVGARSKQRIARMELNLANGHLMVSQHLVRSSGQLQIQPSNLLVIATNQNIVTYSTETHRENE